jgi:hypothetical protein
MKMAEVLRHAERRAAQGAREAERLRRDLRPYLERLEALESRVEALEKKPKDDGATR